VSISKLLASFNVDASFYTFSNWYTFFVFFYPRPIYTHYCFTSMEEQHISGRLVFTLTSKQVKFLGSLRLCGYFSQNVQLQVASNPLFRKSPANLVRRHLLFAKVSQLGLGVPAAVRVMEADIQEEWLVRWSRVQELTHQLLHVADVPACTRGVWISSPAPCWSQ
jgi:hypothetical protein